MIRFSSVLSEFSLFFHNYSPLPETFWIPLADSKHGQMPVLFILCAQVSECSAQHYTRLRWDFQLLGAFTSSPVWFWSANMGIQVGPPLQSGSEVSMVSCRHDMALRRTWYGTSHEVVYTEEIVLFCYENTDLWLLRSSNTCNGPYKEFWNSAYFFSKEEFSLCSNLYSTNAWLRHDNAWLAKLSVASWVTCAVPPLGCAPTSTCFFTPSWPGQLPFFSTR